MTLTTAYSFMPILTRIFPAADPADNSDTVGLLGGGFATVADVPGGVSVPRFYDAAGNLQQQFVVSFASDARIARLASGNVVMVGDDVGGGIDFLTAAATGEVAQNGVVTANPNESNADVAGLANGGFVVVYQADFSVGAANDHDIHFRTGADSGTISTAVSVDSSAADSQNPSVAALADGGFAIAWERIDAGGNSAAWVAVYNANGSVRRAPREFDGSGTINHQVNVTPLTDGGFAVGYEENEFGGSDISLAIFDSVGTFAQYAVPSILPTADSEAAVAGLSNGMILTTFTNFLPGQQEDYNVRGTLVDAATGGLQTSQTDPLAVDISGDLNYGSSVSALGLAGFVVSYTNATSGDVAQKTFQVVRTATGDAADDNFTGDDAVDIVTGSDGNDNLSGKANDDTLTGGNGNDRLDGGPDNDIISGGANNDFLVGGDGADNLNGGSGADALVGGTGNDIYVVDNPGDEVNESSALATEIDTVQSSISYTLGANLENLILTGGGAINGTGNALANTITGNTASNKLSGLAGNDTYFVNNASDLVVEGTGQGVADIITASVSYIMGTSTQVEILRTISNEGTTPINLTGNGFGQTIVGNNGANVIDGGGSADILQGLGGSDTYIVDGNDDLVTELSTQGVADRVKASASFTLAAGVYVEQLTTTLATATTAINLTGNALKQEITGNAGANLLNSGGAGASDTLRGLAGSDTYRVHNTGDTIVEAAGQGTDKAITSISYALGSGVNVEVLQTNVSAGTSAINLYGNEIAQEIIGNAGANRIDGKGGADTLRGLGGADTFVFATKLGGGNTDTIVDFNPAADRFLLSDAIFTALSPGTITADQFRANTTGEARDSTDRIIYDTDSGGIFYDADGLGGAAGVRFAIVSTGLSITNADFDVV